MEYQINILLLKLINYLRNILIALGQKIGEDLVIQYGKVYKMTCVSLRLFNVYGTRSRSEALYGAVLGVFLSQKVNNYPWATIVGNGKQTKIMLVILSMRFTQYTKAKKSW